MKRRMIRRVSQCRRGTAAVEVAIFAPIFLALTLGVTDLGTGMFMRMMLNAATQAGAAYAVINHGTDCASMTTSCLNGIEAAMNNASGLDGSNGQPAFCTGSVCSTSLTACPAPNNGTCFYDIGELSVLNDFAKRTLLVVINWNRVDSNDRAGFVR